MEIFSGGLLELVLIAQKVFFLPEKDFQREDVKVIKATEEIVKIKASAIQNNF